MSKLIAAMNMTLDGYCDHTAMIADEELHDHYIGMLHTAGAILYGRKTYQLMESYWPSVAIDNVPKIVFSRTLKSIDWKNTTLKNEFIKEEISELVQKIG